ncbi:MAG: hypothetical protein ACOYMF_18455 [Bacteroidales bacterium]
MKPRLIVFLSILGIICFQMINIARMNLEEFILALLAASPHSICEGC